MSLKYLFFLLPFAFLILYITSASQHTRQHPTSHHILSNGHDHLGSPNSSLSKFFMSHAKILSSSAISTANYALWCMVCLQQKKITLLHFDYNSKTYLLILGPEYPRFINRLVIHPLVPAYVVVFLSSILS